jgi:cell division septation protein DedD
MRAAPAAPSPALEEKVSEKSAGQQLALVKNKPMENIPEKKALARPLPKALEGYVIQLAFSDKGAAQHWAETLERRGFAVSMTQAGSAGSLRVRFGNFAVRDDAERQLRTLRQKGLNGIVINLPQAYRPEIHPPVAENSGKSASAAP